MASQTRYIFITGGVVSSLGKGLASAALGAILKARGYSVRMRKLDPYLNLDPGTMSPYQHGEVFVTDDGAETDLDLGHYERFTGTHARKSDNITAGRIYQNILDREREGGYLGKTVQVIPHVTDEIKAFITHDMTGIDFALIEIGGTVGDIEALPFFEAIRQLGNELPRHHSLYMHLTLVPFIASSGELKTKPTQHSAKELRSIGVQPDILLLRSDRSIPAPEKDKIARFCNVRPSAVIEALDAISIYDVPLAYSRAGLDREVLAHFNIKADAPADLSAWQTISNAIHHPEGDVTIGIIGKYTGLKDAYKSLIEALTHAGIANRVRVNIEWIDSSLFETEAPEQYLQMLHAILVPGGFGQRGTEGKIKAIEFARTRKVPFLGICLGMQLAVIETARHLLGLTKAGSSEFSTDCPEPVVGLLTEWVRGNTTEHRSHTEAVGGTLRLGAYPASLKPGTLAETIYQSQAIEERHRHRYEINIDYQQKLEAVGMCFSGLSPDGNLPEIVEIKDHPWFVGVQYHPELKSKPFDPHPLFKAFIHAALKQSRIV